MPSHWMGIAHIQTTTTTLDITHYVTRPADAFRLSIREDAPDSEMVASADEERGREWISQRRNRGEEGQREREVLTAVQRGRMRTSRCEDLALRLRPALE